MNNYHESIYLVEVTATNDREMQFSKNVKVKNMGMIAFTKSSELSRAYEELYNKCEEITGGGCYITRIELRR